MNKHAFLKRTLALLLAFLLAAGCFAGCGAEQTPPEQTEASTQNIAPSLDQDINQSGEDMFELPDFTIGTLPYEDSTEGTEPSEPATVPPLATTIPAKVGKTLATKAGEKISYVMIYNPGIYTDDTNAQTLGSGKLSQYIDVDLNRADGLAEDPEIVPYAQKPLDPAILAEANLEGGRADGLAQFYLKGDKLNFYCGAEEDINLTVEQTFTCVYAGNHANIWTYTKEDQALMDKLGTAFDEKIYDECVSRFGEPRFGEMVNILIYPFEGNTSTVGFFYPGDLYSSFEINDITAQTYGLNRDHNVININALWLDREDTVISTLAHEFQHLICSTSDFTSGNTCDVWFNEAMSGYIEEALYPGIQLSSVQCYHTSHLIREGQSLYNFKTDTGMLTFDIGVYGSVYLYAEYLKNIAGEDVFHQFHDNWRKTFTPITTFGGVYQTVSPELQAQIDQMIIYPNTLVFASEEEEWMSKLTLLFYLSTFTKDPSTPEQYREIALPYLLYDSMMEAQIEGGGRIVLATKDGKFQIPQDADPGLIFVGLNENMEVVTNLVCS